ncbi:MAG: hypothetical protein ACRDK7_00575 [Solirubrobacteraceae bacterium]
MQITLAVLAGLACLLVAASAARAGSFTALTCHDSGGNAIGTPGWSVGQANGQYITFGASCANGGEGSFGLTMGPNPTAEYYNGDGNTMTYSVPAGLTILDYSLQLYAFGGPCGIQDGQCADGFGQVYVNHTGQSDPNYDYRNLGYGAATTTVAASGLSGVSGVTVGVSCDPGQDLSYPCPGSADPEAQALVSDGAFTLLDATVPSVSNVSGSLVVGGTLTGTDTINFTASDSGGGIYSAAVLVDGRMVVQEVPDDNGGLCVNLAPASSAAMAFASPQPCVSSENVSIPLDTTQFAAGQHHLQVLVTDAAGDQAIAYDGTITTAGPPLVGVNGGLRGPHVANGEPCAGEELNVQVNRKAKPAVIAYGKPVTVRGVLHCGTVPIRNARVVIVTVGAPPGAAIDTSVQSALDGSFSYKVPTGPDRTLEFSYTAYSDDPSPSATATAAIRIRPRIRLRIGPRHASDGSTIHWRGTISGGPYPHHGVGLVVEVKYGRGWRSFDQIVANRKGRFRYSYRFHATTQVTTYTFRVTLPDAGSAGYPYTSGASNQVKVHVTP